MKRKVKMKRKEPVIDKLFFRHPMGGMTPYPPEDCPGSRVFVDVNGIKWVDNYYCATICKPKLCQEYKDYRNSLYKKMGKEV